MKRSTKLAIAGLLLSTPVGMQAQAVPPTPEVAAAIDPARLAIAHRLTEKLLPPGIYRAIMKSTMDQVVGGMSKQMFDMPIRSFVKAGGISDEQAAKLGPVTINQVMAIMDPAFEQRMTITMHVMGDELGALMTQMEPEYRDGLAEAYAARFTVAQLSELDRFFSTPTGAAYAGQAILIYTDPAMMRRMQGMMPRIMNAMPAIIAKVTAATASLPKAKNKDSLTDADKAKIEKLLLPSKGASQ